MQFLMSLKEREFKRIQIFVDGLLNEQVSKILEYVSHIFNMGTYRFHTFLHGFLELILKILLVMKRKIFKFVNSRRPKLIYLKYEIFSYKIKSH